MIRQAMDFDARPDPCVLCRHNARSDRREQLTSLLSAFAFLFCGLTVVLLDGSLALAVGLGLAACILTAVLSVLAQHRLEQRRLRACGGCR